MTSCKICGKEGFHKLSCTNNNVRVAIPMTMHSAYIPTLEGDEAEEFIRKADDTKKGSVDWSKQMEDCKKILEKSEIPIYLDANNHVWRKHYLNGGKVCQVCGKAKEEQERNKDVEP